MATTYDELVCKVNERLRTKKYHEMFVGFPDLDLEEVNPWTYWQGRNIRHPKILLVGQDWGSLESSEKFKKAIRDMMKEPYASNEVSYFKEYNKQERESKGFDTDRNLTELFKELGDYPDISDYTYKDLFFTNLIPGLRKEGSSTGGFKAEWVTPDVKNDFQELVEILHPQIIICLGEDTYKQVALSYGHKKVLKGYSLNDFLDAQYEPEEIVTGSGYVTHMFCVAHPGFYGTFIRNGRIHLVEKEKLKKQQKDWQHIRKWMNQNL